MIFESYVRVYPSEACLLLGMLFHMLSDYPLISSPTFEMYMNLCERSVLEVSLTRDKRNSQSTRQLIQNSIDRVESFNSSTHFGSACLAF